MPTNEAQCRVRLEYAQPAGGEKEGVLHQPADDNAVVSTQPSTQPSLLLRPLSPHLNISYGMRLKWAQVISNEFSEYVKSKKPVGICNWDFVLKLDGSVQDIGDKSQPSLGNEAKVSQKVYPARYKIPEVLYTGLSSRSQRVSHANLFALGTLQYTLLSLKEPFEGCTDNEVQIKYAAGEFPDDVWDMPMAESMLSCWCPKFKQEFIEAAKKNNGSLAQRTGNYIKYHPIRFSFQVIGGISLVTSLTALPLLGALGFAAAGPVTGSAAAAWQASLGLVEAGSFFAWCQSAAMGGAAVNAIAGTGLAGLAGLAGGSLGGQNDQRRQLLQEIFSRAWERSVGT